MKVKRQYCEDCKFFWKAASANDNGICRRFPPTITAIYDSDDQRSHEITVYPAVNEKEWCGEWRDAGSK